MLCVREHCEGGLGLESGSGSESGSGLASGSGLSKFREMSTTGLQPDMSFGDRDICNALRSWLGSRFGSGLGLGLGLGL